MKEPIINRILREGKQGNQGEVRRAKPFFSLLIWQKSPILARCAYCGIPGREILVKQKGDRRWPPERYCARHGRELAFAMAATGTPQMLEADGHQTLLDVGGAPSGLS